MAADVYWLTQKMGDVPDGDAWLAPGESARLSDMRFPKRRDDWTLGRWTAKRAVLAYLARSGQVVSSPTVEIGTASDGAPHVWIRGRPADLSLSLSHSTGISLAVVAGPEVALGCDLELVESRPENFFKDFFTARENEYLARCSPHERPVLSTLIWSAKESVLKCLREGLRRDTRSVAVTVPPTQATRSWRPLSVSCVELASMFGGWWRLEGSHVQVVTASPSPAVPSPLIVR